LQDKIKGIIENPQEKPTPLYWKLVKFGGKIVPFAGYALPVQFSGIKQEHMAVRTAAGLFDVSHMGEFLLEGADALANLQYLLTNDFNGMKIGQVRYSPLCRADGGVLDDLLVYRRAQDAYLLVVNAANREKDAQWISSHIFGAVTFEDASDSYAQLALQGPKAKAILATLGDAAQFPKRNYTFRENVAIAGIPCLLSRTGYTGEDGFELYLPAADAPALYEALMEAGQPFGLLPCGLGARDTLRLEAAMPLYGHEMNETVSPMETGLGWAVKLQKEADFIGKAALQGAGKPKRCRIGLELLERGIAREGDGVLLDGKPIGSVTSGTMCPFVEKIAAMALVESESVNVGDEIAVSVRGKQLRAKVIPLPFYQRQK